MNETRNVKQHDDPSTWGMAETIAGVYSRRESFLIHHAKIVLESYERACQERDNWKADAERFCRDVEYWRCRAEAAERALGGQP